MRPLLIDLYCGAGGAGEGYRQAGWNVLGIDLMRQPRYPEPHLFFQADVFEWGRILIATADAVHASPTCQKWTAMRTMPNAKEHPDLVTPTREMLIASGKPWIMENVEGAPLVNPVTLCGTMFDLGVPGAQLQRHRNFEASFPISAPGPCRHDPDLDVLGIYGGHVRNRRRRDGSQDRGVTDFTQAQGNAAMGIDWMTLGELSQAIPPAYTRHLGRQLMEQL